MVSSPPPVRFKLLLFGVFVVLVAVVTFMVLYMLNPFESKRPAPPAQEEVAPAEKEAAAPAVSKIEHSKSGFEKKKDTAPKEPAVADSKPDSPDPEPAPTGDAKATVGEPLFEEKSGQWQITFKTGSELKYKHFTLKDPPRLAVDFLKARYTGKERLLDSPAPFISKIRVGEKPEYTRYVIDFTENKVPSYETASDPSGVVLTFAKID